MVLRHTSQYSRLPVMDSRARRKQNASSAFVPQFPLVFCPTDQEAKSWTRSVLPTWATLKSIILSTKSASEVNSMMVKRLVNAMYSTKLRYMETGDISWLHMASHEALGYRCRCTHTTRLRDFLRFNFCRRRGGGDFYSLVKGEKISVIFWRVIRYLLFILYSVSNGTGDFVDDVT